MEVLVGIIILLVCLSGIHGWFSDKSTKLREDEYNRELRKKLDEETRRLSERVQQAEEEHERRRVYLDSRDAAFKQGYLSGRRWLADFIAESERCYDESIANALRTKKHPAMKAAEQVSDARREKRKYKERAKFLEYQLKSYVEYFPVLAEYEEAILDEAVELTGDSVDELESNDPVLKFVSKQEYESLATSERNQLALDRYLQRHHSQATIGRFYERYLGYLYEEDGWEVEYVGVFKGLEDLGRDLICTRDGKVRIIQAKCWSVEKIIHEKHIFQLFGTTQLYLMSIERRDLFPSSVTPMFITTTNLSEVALDAAARLKIEVQAQFKLDKSYPMIKCNISQRTRERIYHMPMDQQYDKVKIDRTIGECYVRTAAEAESLGFRRAFRYRPNAQS